MRAAPCQLVAFEPYPNDVLRAGFPGLTELVPMLAEDIPLERFVLNIERYGNTSSASIPIALDEALRDGRIQRGDTVLMSALGAGISWGSALIRV